MKFFDKFRVNKAAQRLMEEELYEEIVNELQGGYKRDGLWAKAIANSHGSEEKAKSLYIKYRIQSIKDENTASEILLKEEQTKREHQLRVEAEEKKAEEIVKAEEEKQRIKKLKKNLRRTGGKYIEGK